jgi:hypothetical protein
VGVSGLHCVRFHEVHWLEPFALPDGKCMHTNAIVSTHCDKGKRSFAFDFCAFEMMFR